MSLIALIARMTSGRLDGDEQVVFSGDAHIMKTPDYLARETFRCNKLKKHNMHLSFIRFMFEQNCNILYE